MSYQLDSSYPSEFSIIKNDFKLANEEYLKYLNIAYKLEKKGFLSLAEKRRRTSKINPEFHIDDMIFNKLILGFDYLDEVDFSNIGYLGTFGKNATKNFKLTLKSDTLLYEPLELIFPYKDTLSTPKTISSSIS